MISTVSAVKAKVGLWTSQQRNGRLMHFPKLERLEQNEKFLRFISVCSGWNGGGCQIQLKQVQFDTKEGFASK